MSERMSGRESVCEREREREREREEGGSVRGDMEDRG